MSSIGFLAHLTRCDARTWSAARRLSDVGGNVVLPSVDDLAFELLRRQDALDARRLVGADEFRRLAHGDPPCVWVKAITGGARPTSYYGGREESQIGALLERAPSMAADPLTRVLPALLRRSGVRPTLGDSPHG
jgi:hypothetical protein